ncbi:MAG: glycerol-3-phosphate acyltransferase [Clostridia bacterium]|nr:glycerol-3-phosphate acyltransferase [Clostridia bacterium]
MTVSFSMLWWQFLLLAIGSYLMGNVNFAIIISKLKKRDIRTLGSGNPGTLNMSRNFGMGIGVLTLVLDMLKGAIPTFVGYIIYKDMVFAGSTLPISEVVMVGCGFFAVLGHIFPVFMRFKGGKGIATTIGVFMVCSPLVTAISGVVAIAFILITEIGAMGSFIATTPGAIATSYSVYKYYVEAQVQSPLQITLVAVANVFIIAIIILTWIAHRQNIKRLITSEEHPTNWMQMIREAKIKRKNKKNKLENK